MIKYLLIPFLLTNSYMFAQVCFEKTNYSLPNGNIALSSADYNNDGKKDIAVGTNPSGVYLLYGDGQGNFGPAMVMPDSSSDARSIVSADFNGDGNIDIALTVMGMNAVKVYFGDGAGNFPTRDSFQTGITPVRLTKGDFNNDGNIDLASANSSVPGTVSVLLNNGSGIFSSHTEYPTGSSAVAVTSGDFNGDNNADLAVVNGSSGGPDSVSILAGNGLGAFGVTVNYAVGAGPYSVFSSDFNNDSYDDVAVANINSNNVSVLISQGGNGLFNPSVNYQITSVPFSVYGADFNSDGNMDLVTANFGSAKVSVLLGTGSGTFGTTKDFGVAYGPWAVLADDFNADGSPDIAAANHDTPVISVLINREAPAVSVALSADSICPGTSVTLTANGATSYTWSANTTNIDTSGTFATVAPNVSTAFSVVGEKNGCEDSVTIVVNVLSPEIPTICMATADSSSSYQYNTIYWDNTIYTNADSFIIYRHDVITNSYLRIGAAASSDYFFQDTAFTIGGPNGGNPFYSSWKYKLAVKDVCGTTGQKSPYHQTMFVQQSGSNFSWNAYAVESGSNPVTGYSLLRDDSSTNNWHVLVNTSALSSTDPNYLNYSNGNWRIDALGFNCSDFSSGFTNKKSHSNIVKQYAIGIDEKKALLAVNLYPNPSSGKISFEIPATNKGSIQINIFNALGYSVFSEMRNTGDATITVDLSSKPDGIYLLEIRTGENRIQKKIIIEK